MSAPYIELTVSDAKGPHTFRFYGRGTWKVQAGTGWHPINAILVPADVLRAAADYCWPPAAGAAFVNVGDQDIDYYALSNGLSGVFPDGTRFGDDDAA